MTSTRRAAPDRVQSEPAPPDHREALLHLGRRAWALLGVVVWAVLVWLVISRLSLVVMPLLLALFPTAALFPATRWMARRRVPRMLAAFLALLGGLVVFGGLIVAIVPTFIAQLPDLAESITSSVRRLQPLLDRLPGLPDGTSVPELAQRAAGGLTGGSVMQTVLGATRSAVDVLTGTGLLLVAVFFYLAQGGRITGAVIGILPRRHHQLAHDLADQVWETVGTFFRVQCVVAIIDAVLIGTGLALLGVPLALPLAVLVFIGGFFPFVGAFVSGLFATLVALADGGLQLAVVVLALVLAVQTLEGNVIEPLLAGRTLRLSAFGIIVAVAVGSTLLGVLGAFLAVPVTAAAIRTAQLLRRRQADQPAHNRPPASAGAERGDGS